MAGLRLRSDSGRRARGLNVSDHVNLDFLWRWDGVSRTCSGWDTLRRDPEIWERNGNCLIHLYGKGESRRGPSFKLPFSTLIATSCYPLIERFLAHDGFIPSALGNIEKWDRRHPRSTVELYIPAPPSSTDAQAFAYHLTIRNFLAWVLGRPMAGEFLGSALVGIREVMQEFRSTSDSSNDDDMMDYLRQAGYLDMAEEPSYALALLHLAETFRMKELYSMAFAHCVGMYGSLAGCPEYQLTSSTSRNLIKEARITMNSEHLRTSDMLRSFLDDELSVSYLGIPSGIRAHLERFRCFLLSFYSVKSGYYPPKKFDAPLLRSMATDFEALYNLLADSSLRSTDTMPPTHVGGICTLQLVQAFDERHNFESQEHPLPQLPCIDLPSSARLLTWFTRGEKTMSKQRHVTHAALVKSSNWTTDIFKNELVRAYRKFEEDSVMFPRKADKHERVSVADARKVRWILIYAIYQVLSRATKQPVEVEDQKTSYHLNVSMKGVPPWKEKYELTDESVSPRGLGCRRKSRVSWAFGGAGDDDDDDDDDNDNDHDHEDGRNPSAMIEIKPDIDYLALTQKDRRSPSMSSISESTTPTVSRSSSFSINLRRSSTLRRSLRRITPGSFPDAQKYLLPTIPYHEIVVQGYGNGTQHVTGEPMEGVVLKKSLMAGRSDSTASSQSNFSSRAESTIESMCSTLDTLPSTVTTSGQSSPVEDDEEMEQVLARWGPQEKSPTRTDTPITFEPFESETAEAKSYGGPFDRYTMLRKKWSGNNDTSVATTRDGGIQRRHTLMLDMRRKPNEILEKLVAPRIRNSEDDEIWMSRRKSDEWSIMQAFMDGPEPKAESKDEWAQYAGLGGLIDLRC